MAASGMIYPNGYNAFDNERVRMLLQTNEQFMISQKRPI